jgi:uncharacterized membrane protein
MMMGMMGFGLIGTLLFVGLLGALVVAGVVWAARRQPLGQHGTHVPQARGDAHEILRERMARGEIVREEYQSIRRALEE